MDTATTREKYEALSRLGLSKSETARAMGVTVQAVDNAALRYGLTFANGNAKRRKDAHESKGGLGKGHDPDRTPPAAD
jgi:hypothetical protein